MRITWKSRVFLFIKNKIFVHKNFFLLRIYTKVSSYLRWIRNFLKGTHNRMLKFNNRKNSKKCEYGKVGKYCDSKLKKFYSIFIRLF